MLAKDCILTRRSIRKFKKGKEIPKEVIHEILYNAMHAPSARNKQPWEFIVIRDPKVCEGLTKIHSACSYVLDSNFAIVVCGNKQESCGDYWPLDGSLASQNILLTAKYLGLGGVFCGVYPSEEREKSFKELLKLPDHVIPLGLIVLGYPDQEPEQPTDRFKESKIHYDSW